MPERQTRAERYFGYLARLPQSRAEAALYAGDWRLIDVQCLGCGLEGRDLPDTPAFGYCGVCFAKLAHIALPCVVCGAGGRRQRPPIVMHRLGPPTREEPVSWACADHYFLARDVDAALQEAML